MKPFALYTVARLATFLVAWLVVWLVASIWLEWNDVTALWTALIALVVSSVVSLVVLRPLRERFAADVGERAARARNRYEESRRKEDADE